MIALHRETRAAYAFVERNFNLVKRYWGWEIVWLSYSIANSLAVTYIGAGMEKISGVKMDTNFLVFYLLIGTLVWHYLSVVFDNISEMISWEHWEGTIEYTFMAPVKRLTQMIGTCVFSTIYGMLHTAIILAVVTIFFRLDLGKANLAGGALVLLAGSLSFIGIGIMAAVLPMLFTERGSQMTHVIQAVLLLISGVYYPVEVLPDWMQPVAHLSPATYVLEGMRQSLLQGVDTASLLGFIIPLVLVGVVAIPLGLVVFGWGERYAKRTGARRERGKKAIAGNVIQLVTNDGRTFKEKKTDACVGDSLLIVVPGQKIVKVIKQAPGKTVFVVDGKHIGLVAKVKDFVAGTMRRPKLANLETTDGEFSTVESNIVIVGDDKPAIKLGE